MKIKSTNIQGLFTIEPIVYSDKRGYFLETFRDDIFKSKFPNINFCQDNESKSGFGILRGLHYQLPPFAQTKLVRVISGSILDVAVDLRLSSKSYGKYFSVELNDQNKKQLLIPKGFAHGFIVLSEYAIVNYKVDNYYKASCDRGISFNDPDLNIDWKLKFTEIKFSKKDSNHPLLCNAEVFVNL